MTSCTRHACVHSGPCQTPNLCSCSQVIVVSSIGQQESIIRGVTQQAVTEGCENTTSSTEGRPGGMPSTEVPCPYDEAGFMSRMTFWWMHRLYVTAFRRRLNNEDIHPTPHWARAQSCSTEFRSVWQNRAADGKRWSLLRCLLYHFRRNIATVVALSTLAECLKAVHPVLVVYMALYMRGSEEVSTAVVSVLVVVSTLISLVYSVLFDQVCHMIYTTAMNMRTICGAQIFKKVLSMSAASRRETTSGHIVNLMATDIETFHMGLLILLPIVATPASVLVVLVLAGREVGVAVVAGLGVIIVYLILRSLTGRLQGRIRLTVAGWTDKRVHLMEEIIAAIRVVKMYCWEKPFAARIKSLRRSEMRHHGKNVTLLYASLATSTFTWKIVVYVILLVYMSTGNDITPQISLMLVGWLKSLESVVFITTGVSLATFAEMASACRRIQDFLERDETTGDEPPQSTCQGPGVRLEDVNATWTKDSKYLKDAMTDSLKLEHISLQSSKMQFIGIVGPVGSGKSSVLMAILNEMIITSGSRSVHGSIAYVPQQSWIISDTVRANILMGQEMDEDRYEAVISACALDEDFTRLPDGDLSLVGERGLSLSGGQKARINLARATYRDADIYLLDDPFSSVDTQVGNTIFSRCLCGILQSKIRILVTHQLRFLPSVDTVIVMDKGRVVASGSYQEVSSHVVLSSYASQTPGADVAGTILDDLKDGDVAEDAQPAAQENGGVRAIVPEGTGNDMTGNLGDNSFRVYLQYLRAGRGAVLVPLFIVVCCLKMVIDVAGDWWLAQWHGNRTITGRVTFLKQEIELPYMETATVLVLALICVCYIQATVVAMLIVTASRRLYSAMFYKVLRAPMVFFERSPVGQILNRFSRDTGFMDNLIPFALFFSLEYISRVFSHVIYGCVISPWMTIGALVLLAAFCLVGWLSLKCIQDIKRMETSLRSPTYSLLSATLQGITVIRAHSLENHVLTEFHSHMDRHTAAWFLYFSSQRCLSALINILGNIYTLIYMIFVLSTQRNDVQSGTTALAFVYLLYMKSPLQYGIQRMAEVELAMTSVRRILEYCNLEQEAPEHTDVTPPGGWPQRGEIILRDMSLTYRGMERPALGPISLWINGGEKIGVVGRTGAGKSSLFTSLLRLVEPTGSIVIDGCDVMKMGLIDLRGKISVIPQDPMFFCGTLRNNLDLFTEFEDEDIWKVLEQVHLETKVRSLTGGLTADVGEAGSNFSVGQRQLLCLARALLRRNKIIIIDEATANVDYWTDETIQETLETQFTSCTVLTIAHRMLSVVRSDKILVLHEGKVAQFGSPRVLLDDRSGRFYQMAHQLGEGELELLFSRLGRRLCEPPRDALEPTPNHPADFSIDGAHINRAFETS